MSFIGTLLITAVEIGAQRLVELRMQVNKSRVDNVVNLDGDVESSVVNKVYELYLGVTVLV